jgi:hypothetical protein
MLALSPATATAYHCGGNPYTGYSCKELEIEALSPPIGSSFEEGQEGPWVMIAAHGLLYPQVYVAYSPETGSDGHTLSDLYSADWFLFFESSTDEGVYTSAGPSRYLRAGTYYWQMEAGGGPEYQTPIYTFVVTPKPEPPSPPAAPPPSPPAAPPPSPPPPASPPTTTACVIDCIPYEAPMLLGDAYYVVNEIIELRTGHNAYHLHRKCKTGPNTATCKATWATARRLRSRTLLYSGTFSLRGGLWAFSGTRERVGCVRRFGAKHCASKVHWKG